MYRKITMLMLIGIFAVSSVSAQSNWSAFWLKFKTAVVKSDKKTVYSLSKTPDLPDDEYKELFGSKEKRNCFAKAKPVKDKQIGYSVFCGEQGYYFQKIDGKFKFVETFAND